MNMKLKDFRGAILRHLFLDQEVDDFYRKFQKQYPEFTKNNRWAAIKYILRLNMAQYKRSPLKNVSMPLNIKDYLFLSSTSSSTSPKDIRYFVAGHKTRKSVDEFTAILAEYDVISFDIFDTALYRKVEFPADVFKLMAGEMEHNDFSSIRKKAESEAREYKERNSGTREVTLDDIYEIY